MNRKLLAVLGALLVAGCTPPEAPAPKFVVEGATGDSAILWSSYEQMFYQIRLACIDEAGGPESRNVLLGNLDAADQISVVPIGEAELTGTPQKKIYAITAEVFVNLSDGAKSVNEAQLLAGLAKLRKDANLQNCPRLEAMKQAQQEAKEGRAGVWGYVK